MVPFVMKGMTLRKDTLTLKIGLRKKQLKQNDNKPSNIKFGILYSTTGKLMYTLQPTQIVINSIRNSFPNQAEQILKDLKYDCIMGCWYFTLNSIFVGVESDGYVHS
jgi:hypothetical protein